MTLKFTKEDRDIIHRVHLLSGKPYEEVRDMFESFCTVAIMAYIEKEPVTIPLIGTMEVEYVNDVLTPEGKEANVKITTEASPNFKHIVGQIEDEEETDIEKSLQSKIENILKSMV